MKQLLLILNPTSGTKKGQKYLAEIISIFNQAGYDTHVHITHAHGDGTEAVLRQGAGMDLIVCCGGDGTLNETITGIIQTGLNIPIGYIPAGSTNDYASSLHLSPNPVEAARQIISGTPHFYDIGAFGGRYFTYIASFGAFTRTSYTTPQNVKNALGHFAYVLEGIQEVPRIKKEHIRMELDGEVIEGDYLFGAVCNCTSVGGVLALDPEQVDMSDGLFEIFLVREPRDVQELLECENALRTKKYNCGMLTFRKAAAVTVHTNPDLPWTLDGERADGQEAVLIQNLHRRIQMLH